MAQTGPVVRIDREYLNEFELKVAEIALYQMADLINALTRKGAIYGQIVLPPEIAARKRQMMGGQ